MLFVSSFGKTALDNNEIQLRTIHVSYPLVKGMILYGHYIIKMEQ